MINRTIRFAYGGIIFVAAIILFLIGWERSITSFFYEEDKIVQLISTIVACPIIGFILSSLAIGATRLLILPNGSEFLNPRPEIAAKYFEVITKYFTPQQCGLVLQGEQFIVTDVRLLYNTHASLFANKANSEAINFSSRRIDVYTMQITNITSILMALVLSLFLFNLLPWEPKFIPFKCLIFPAIAVYIVAAIFQARQALRDANNFEKLFIISQCA